MDKIVHLFVFSTFQAARNIGRKVLFLFSYIQCKTFSKCPARWLQLFLVLIFNISRDLLVQRVSEISSIKTFCPNLVGKLIPGVI